MRAQLETIYENLYDDYRFFFPSRPLELPNLTLINSIQRVIQEAEIEHMTTSQIVELVKIRSDAK
jgi:hypothetical protein